MTDLRTAPRVSVITPTLNAATFLRATLESVASQSRADVEHLVVDGGSNDDTRDIVRRYSHARLIEFPGSRQTEAMNAGVVAAQGSFIILLNADDLLQPGAVEALLAGFDRSPEADVVYGDAIQVDERGLTLEPYPARPFDRAALIEACIIPQAATMIRKSSFIAAGGLDPQLDFAMDYDLWLRLSRTARFVKIDAPVAHVRLHASAKTVARRSDIYREAIAVLLKHEGYVPYTWLYGYADYRLQPDDQVFDPRRASPLKVMYSLVLALTVNWRRPVRALRDWLVHRGIAARLRGR